MMWLSENNVTLYSSVTTFYKAECNTEESFVGPLERPT